jgi:hypothetical protein
VPADAIKTTIKVDSEEEKSNRPQEIKLKPQEPSKLKVLYLI